MNERERKEEYLYEVKKEGKKERSRKEEDG